MAKYRGTPLHAFRVPDELWTEAREVAASNGSSLAAELNAFLRRYVSRKRRAEASK